MQQFGTEQHLAFRPRAAILEKWWMIKGKVEELRFRRTSRDKRDEIVTKHEKCN
jgi:hypothetical protein